jgi:hypothetical protein
MYSVPDRMVIMDGSGRQLLDTGSVQYEGSLDIQFPPDKNGIIKVVMNPGGGIAGTGWTITVTAGPPPVAAKLTGTNLVLSWPTNTTGVLLEYTTNLATKTWVTNTATLYKINGQYVITNGVAPKGAKFYRLYKP